MMKITFILAFCSITYEFILSHTLSVLLGGTFFRYTTTVSLYITALGAGAFCLDYILPSKKQNLNLLKVELYLATLGALSPFLGVFLDGVFQNYFLVSVSCYVLVFCIGFLSGLELPLLMRISEYFQKGSGIKALSVDFLGTCAGCLIFATFLLPYLGIFNTASFTALINFLTALCILKFYLSQEERKKQRLSPFMWITPLSILISCSPWFQSWILERFYF